MSQSVLALLAQHELRSQYAYSVLRQVVMALTARGVPPDRLDRGQRGGPPWPAWDAPSGRPDGGIILVAGEQDLINAPPQPEGVLQSRMVYLQLVPGARHVGRRAWWVIGDHKHNMAIMDEFAETLKEMRK